MSQTQQMNESQLVRVRRYSSPDQAQLARLFLLEHNIQCAVTGELISRSLSWYGMAVNKTELLVHAENAEEANDLLNENEAEYARQHTGQWGTKDDLGWVCPECDEKNGRTFDECWSCGQLIPADPERCDVDDAPQAVARICENATREDTSPYRAPKYQESHTELSPQDELVRRMIRTSIFSLFFPPLAFYGLYLAVRIFEKGNPPRRVYLAIALNGIMIVTLVVLGVILPFV